MTEDRDKIMQKVRDMVKRESVKLRWFDRHGNEISRDLWCDLFDDDDYRVVETDEIECWMISTVWVGHDQRGDFKTKKPLMFETSVFDQSTPDFYSDGVASALGVEIVQMRARTESDALENHAAALMLAYEGKLPRGNKT